MKYFDGLVDASFKIDDKGNTIFYPLWIFGKGYILPVDKKDKFRLTIKFFLLICVPLAITFSTFLNLPRFFLIILPLYFFGCATWVKKNTKGFATSPDKRTLSDTTKNFPHSYNEVIMWLFEIVSFLFVLASIFLLSRILVELVKN
jgi:Ca2+/Na+ antiporter